MRENNSGNVNLNNWEGCQWTDSQQHSEYNAAWARDDHRLLHRSTLVSSEPINSCSVCLSPVWLLRVVHFWRTTASLKGQTGYWIRSGSWLRHSKGGIHRVPVEHDGNGMQESPIRGVEEDQLDMCGFFLQGIRPKSRWLEKWVSPARLFWMIQKRGGHLQRKTAMTGTVSKPWKRNLGGGRRGKTGCTDDKQADMNASSCEHATTPVNTFLFGSAVPCRPLSQTPTGHFYTSIQGEKQAHEDASVDPEFSDRLELREFFALPLKTTFFFHSIALPSRTAYGVPVHWSSAMVLQCIHFSFFWRPMKGFFCPAHIVS